MALVAVETHSKLHENRGVRFLFSCGEGVFQRRSLGVLFFLFATASLLPARDLAVVSNKSNGVNAIPLPELVKICKAEVSRWPDGKPVTFVMRAPSSPEVALFLERVYQLSAAQVQELIANANHGRANHPAIVIVKSDEELVNKVASMPGAVGVVDVYAINSSVEVLKVAGKLPLEPGYILHGN
jgi:hypothetical protein